MNKELYKNIKNELDSLEEELATINYVGAHLLNEKLLGKSGKDRFTVIFAFYEYMSQKKEFSFIKEGEWAKFYRESFSNYLTKDVIKSNLDEIVNNEKLLATILEVCNENVKNDLYTYVRVENAIHTKTGSDKYLQVYKKIEESLIKQGVIENPNKVDDVAFSDDKTSKSIDEELESLKKRQADLENQKVQKRDSLFKQASNSIGINEQKLIKRVGKDESLNIDRIEVDPRLVSKLAANSAIAATMPKNVYQKIKSKVLSAKTFNNLELEILDNDGLSTLKVVKKENIFDKIASSDNALVRAIYNSAKRRLSLLKQLVKPSKEINAVIKEAFVNTSRRIKESALKTATEVKTEYREFKKDLNESFEEAKENAASKINDFANRVSDYGVSVREKASETLYNIGDRIAPDGKRKNVIIKGATKVDEIPNVLTEESSKKM